MAAAAALADVHQCLEWIGFGDVQHRNAIIDEGGFDTDFYDINETDIRDMAERFFKAISCRQSHHLRYAEDQVAHINDVLGPRPPTMFRGPRPR